MTATPRNHVSDVRGATALAIDATAGVVEIVAAMQAGIARMPLRLGGPIVERAASGIPSVVYRTIHAVTRTVGAGIDTVLAPIEPLLGGVASSAARDALVAALNGVVGDHLAATGNPLAIPMRLRRDGEPLELTRERLAAAFPCAGGKIAVFVHGLCMNDRQWNGAAHCHGRELERELGFAAVYLHYNTGRHVSTSGQAMTAVLEELVAAWPVAVEELVIIAHSMGGLVARSAHHYGTRAGHAWTRRLSKLVFLGTPHHGAALERAGHGLHRLLALAPYTNPLSRLGKIRSAGITDLRHGNVLDEDWQDGDRFSDGRDMRRPVPLPDRVRCYTIAATRGTSADGIASRLVGDGLVPLASALGRHVDERFVLAFPAAHQWVAHATGHLDLLTRPAVYLQIRDWLSAPPSLLAP